jgi:hypothetical protein
MSRKVLVIGAQGVVGSFAARAFAEAGWHVTRAGRRPEDAPDFRLVDLGEPATVQAACREADLVVGTVHHPELTLQRTILRDGGTLIDLGELSVAERAELRREAGEGGGLVVQDAGLAGVAYLAIAELLAEHPDADAAHYALMFSTSMSMGRAGALFAHGLLTGSAHHPTATIPFPEPIGRRRCLELGAEAGSGGGSEAGSGGGSRTEAGGVLRRTVGGRPIRHYLLMQPSSVQRLLLGLNALRAVSLLPQAMLTAGTGRTPPAEPSSEPVCDWVAVSRDGATLATRTIQGTGYYRMTVAATLAVAEALTRSPETGRRTGLFSIDELLTSSEVRPALAAAGIDVRKDAVASGAAEVSNRGDER